MFHAFTGCDKLSSFVGYDKKTGWSTWNTLPQLCDALLKLSCAPSKIPEGVMFIIKRFLILLYMTRPVHAQVETKLSKDYIQREST